MSHTYIHILERASNGGRKEGGREGIILKGVAGRGC